MFQIDEKVIADSRTLITIQNKKEQLDALTKNGTLHYTMTGDNLWLTTPKIRKAYAAKQDYIDKYDKVVLARDGVNIDGSYSFDDPVSFKDNLEVQKDLVVRGNFTVEGQTSIIDTPRLTIEDNIIELNKNEKGNGITLKNSGVAINRGQKEFARTLYSEDNKAFVFDTNADMDAAIDNSKWVAMGYTENSGEYVPGEFRARYRLTAPFGKFTDSLSVVKQTTLNNLSVAGESIFNGTVTSNNDTTVNGIFTANGTSVFNNLLTANKVANFKDNVNIDKVLTVKGTSVFEDKTTHNKGLTIVSEGANITGNSIITGTLKVTENVTLSKDLNVGAKITSDTLDVSNKATLGYVQVKATTQLDGAVSANSSLGVAGTTTLNATVINQSLTVNSASTFKDNVNILNKNLVLNSNADNNGCLTVGGSANIKKTLDVDGDANFDANVSIAGSLTMNSSDIVARNITTKNYFTVEQGDGKGLRFWGSDNYKIYMSSTTSEGRLDTTSDYNMYFKMSSGTNRGFVFKNGSTNVVQIESDGQIRTLGKLIVKGYDALTRENEGHKTDSTGINADQLDGLHATNFLRRNVDTDTTGSITFSTAGKAIKFNGGGAIFKNNAVIIQSENAVNHGVKIQSEAGVDLLTVKDNSTNGLLYKTNKVFHAGNDGHGSGLDADTLDGQHKEYFATADHLHDDRYIRNDEVNLKGKYKIEYNEEFDALDFMYMGDAE